jgi:Tfp pilus assembly protein PilV
MVGIAVIIFMRLNSQHNQVRAIRGRRGAAGFTFAEVLISVIIVALVFATIINGYLAGAKRTQWTGYSLAAQSLSVECLEQMRSAVWDIAMGKNEVTNLTLIGKSYDSTRSTWSGYTTNILDVPWKGTNYIMATNYISIQLLYENNATNVPVQLQLIRVDTVWGFNGWGRFADMYYTNTTCTYIAPDNRDPSTLGGG